MLDDLPGWQTDVEVLRLTGSVVEDRADHLVVRTPDNPGYHWGNFLLVTDAAAVDDADRWVGRFEAAFPDASWVAVGLVRLPGDQRSWVAHGLSVELDDVLSTRTLPRRTALPDGYRARALAGDDWEQHVALAVAENDRTHEHPADGFEHFSRERMQVRRSLTERGLAAFFGAFADDLLVADLGIVRCGTTARYQSVGTHADHRRRGLAGHLLGVAASWAGDHGCDRWVILTEATNPAGRLYRSLGFEPVTGNAQAYRKPSA